MKSETARGKNALNTLQFFNGSNRPECYKQLLEVQCDAAPGLSCEKLESVRKTFSSEFLCLSLGYWVGIK